MKKGIKWTLGILSCFFIISGCNYTIREKNDQTVDAGVKTTSVRTTASPEFHQKLERQQMWAGLTFEQFTDALYSLPVSEQTKAWDTTLKDLTVVWTGIAVSDSHIIRADKYVQGRDVNDYTGEDRAYIVTVRRGKTPYEVGQEMRVVGTLHSRGYFDKPNNDYGNWIVNN